MMLILIFCADFCVVQVYPHRLTCRKSPRLTWAVPCKVPNSSTCVACWPRLRVPTRRLLSSRRFVVQVHEVQAVSCQEGSLCHLEQYSCQTLHPHSDVPQLWLCGKMPPKTHGGACDALQHMWSHQFCRYNSSCSLWNKSPQRVSSLCTYNSPSAFLTVRPGLVQTWQEIEGMNPICERAILHSQTGIAWCNCVQADCRTDISQAASLFPEDTVYIHHAW